MFLSKLGYSELVQRLFEKMTFSLVDPLLELVGVLLQQVLEQERPVLEQLVAEV
jgi:hypothetical protein